jgi:hypothetical protein
MGGTPIASESSRSGDARRAVRHARHCVSWIAFGVIVVAGGIAGCAGTVTRVDVPTPELPQPLLRPLPLSVDLCLGQGIASGRELPNVISDPMLGQLSWRHAPASRAIWESTARAMFADVEVLPTCEATDSAAANRPALTVDMTAIGNVAGRGVAEYDVEFRDPDGRTIAAWHVRGSSSESTFSLYGAALVSKAARNAAAQFMADFSARQEVRNWLEGQGIDPAMQLAVEPSEHDTPDLPDDVLRIAILPAMAETPLTSKNHGAFTCLRRALENARDDVEPLAEGSLERAFFPWLEPKVFNGSPSTLAAAMQSPLLRGRARELGLDYVVVVTDFGKVTKDLHGPFWCGGGFGAAGCLGYGHQDTEASLSAYVWNVRAASSLAEQRESVTKRNHYFGLGLPIPVFRKTRTQACERMAASIFESIASFEPTVTCPASLSSGPPGPACRPARSASAPR